MASYIELRVSKDGGSTWSDWKARDLGEVGDFIKPVIWRRLGNARHFTFDFRATGAPDILAGSIMDAMGEWVEAPVVGGAYADESRPWSSQDTCNYIPVAAEKQGARSMAKLRGAPGERLFANVGTGPIRAARDVEGKLFVVSGTGLYRVFADTSSTLIGTIPGTTRCTLTHNQEGGGSKLVIANGTRGYTYDTITEAFAEIDDEAFPGFLVCDYLDQFILGIEPQRRYAFHSDLADAREYSSLDRFESESSPDRLLAQAVNSGQWWLFGERTIDVYANTGAATGTFQRIPGSTIDRGIAGTHALAKLDNTLFFWGDDGTFYRLNGYTPVRVSTHPIEQAARVCDLSGIFCTVYEDAGHKIVWSTFPDGKTWGYDVASGEWFRRQSFNRQNWRMSTLVKWLGVWLAGDSEDGKLYQVDWALRDEDGAALIGRRTTGALHNNEQRITVNGVRVLVDTGRGAMLPTGTGAIIDPLVIYNPLPEAYVDVAVSHSYLAAGGVQPYVFSIVAGSLPAGLTMSAAGLVTGTPTTAASYAWRVQVLDAQGFTATLDEGQNGGLGIVGPTPFAVGFQPPALLTTFTHYDLPRNALTLAASPMGWTGSVTRVVSSPDGFYAVGFTPGDVTANRFQIRKWNVTTRAWDAVANPADMPSIGPSDAAWNPDGDRLAISVQASSPDNFWIYARSGDTFTKQANPADTLPNIGQCVAWDSTGQRIAVGNGADAAGVYVWDYVAGVCVNRRLANMLATIGQARRVAFLPGVGSRYLLCGNDVGIAAVDPTNSPMRVAASTSVNARIGAFWDRSGGYVITVANSTTTPISVYSFNSSVIGSEAFTFDAFPASQPATVPRDAALSADGDYLALALTSRDEPIIYEIDTPLSPTLTLLTDPTGTGTNLSGVSWTNFGIS